MRIMLKAMRIERSRVLEAEPHQRSEHRLGYANGFKPKTLETRMGAMQLRPAGKALGVPLGGVLLHQRGKLRPREMLE